MTGCRAMVLAAFLLAGCDPGPDEATFQGYMEAPPLLIGPEEGGRLASLAVEEGRRVEPGDRLFEMDDLVYQAQAAEARARLAEAEARLANLRAQQQRPQEIEIIEARRRRAAADLAYAERELERHRDLLRRGVVAKARFDEAEASYQKAKAAVEEANEQIQAARLTGRLHEIKAAAAAVEAAQAALKQAETRLARRSVEAPKSGVVQEVLFRPGEVVAQNRAVLSIQADERLRVRFFVPEPKRAEITLGQQVRVSCDGCATDLTARVSYLAPNAEFTPPIIYGPQERAKLVFMAEATPDGAARALAPGQPVSVHRTRETAVTAAR